MSGPTMRRTNALDLAAPLVVFGLAALVLLRAYYSTLPTMSYTAPAPLAVLAVTELVATRRVRAAVRHDPLAKPMTAIAIARCVALGRASSRVGAAMVGAGGALLAHTLPDAGSVTAAAHDSRVAVLFVAASALLLVAGLLLERAGVDPNRDRRDTEPTR